MSDKIENMENQQDDDKEKKRPVLFIPLVILGLLLLAGATYAVASTVASPDPTEVPTEPATEAATEVVTEEPTFSTEVPTDSPTEEVTDEPTDEPTTEVTDEPEPTQEEPTPTKEPTPPTRVPGTVEPPLQCGNGVCDTTESNATCAIDCPIVVVDSTCGSPCDANGQCTGDYACFNGVCWNAAICEPPPTNDPNDNLTCECEGPDEVCSDGSSSPSDTCVQSECSFDWWASCGGSEGYSSGAPAAQQCTAVYWCPPEDYTEISINCNQLDDLCEGTQEPK